jgi:MFS family permease
MAAAVSAASPEEAQPLGGRGGLRTTYRAFTLFLYNACLAVFLSYGVFFTRVANQFGLPASSASLVFGVFAICFSASSMLLGLFMNARGPGKTILLGGSLMGSGLVLSSAANSFSLLVFTYGVVGGLGAGSMWMPTSYVVFDMFEQERVAQVTGLVSTGTAVGLLFFPPLEYYLISGFGLQFAFFSVGAIILLLTLMAFEESRTSRVVARFDLRGAIGSLKTRRFGLYYAYYAAGNAFARTLVTIFVVPLFESRGMGAFAGTLALSGVGVGSLFGRLTTGVKKGGEEKLAAFGFILQGICAAGLYLSGDLVSITILSLLFGVGYGAYIPEFALMVRKHYGVAHYGTIFGTLLTSFGIGAFVGPVLEGSFVTATGGYSLGFFLAAAVSISVGLHLFYIGGHGKGTEPGPRSGQRFIPTGA